MYGRYRSLFLLSFVVFCGACVASVDEQLPFVELPSLTIAADVDLVASPSHPAFYLGTQSVNAGETVVVIGADTSSAYLLVFHENEVGWVPSILSRDNIGNLNPAVTIEPLDGNCTNYLDVVFDAEQEWSSTIDGNVLVIGSLYRPSIQDDFDATTLALTVDGSGVVGSSDYTDVPLTQNSAIVLFGYSLEGVQRGSWIHFVFDQSNDEAVFFQAMFFADKCGNTAPSVYRLPLGERRSGSNAADSRRDSSVTNERPVQTPEPLVVEHESGVPDIQPSAAARPATRRPLSNSSAESVWDRAAFRDLQAPGRRSYDIAVNTSEEMRWPFEWCAVDESRLGAILRPFNVEFLVDGESVPQSNIRTDRKALRSRWVCDTWSILLLDWPRSRTIELDIHYTLSESIYDGQNSYPAGDYHQVIYATVR